MVLFNKFLKRKPAEKREKGEEKKEGAVAEETASKKIKSASYKTGILLSSLVTEKTTLGNQKGKYAFTAAKSANKIEIKKAVESKYGVKVVKVNVLNTKPRSVKLGRIEGVKPGYKKAIVTLKEGDKIEVGV